MVDSNDVLPGGELVSSNDGDYDPEYRAYDPPPPKWGCVEWAVIVAVVLMAAICMVLLGLSGLLDGVHY